MKKTVFAAGALTIAAALALTVVSCTRDNDLINENQSENTQPVESNKIHVSVGAGMNEGPQTKSVVEYNSTTHERKLKFTAGDRLYVRGVVEMEFDDFGCPQETKIVAGYLDINTSSISPAGTSATFSGDLQFYEGPIEEQFDEVWVVDGEEEVESEWDEEGNPIGWEFQEVGHMELEPVSCSVEHYYESTYDFGGSNPLDVCSYAYAVLVHKDGAGLCEILDDMSLLVRNYDYMASNAEAFMKSALEVDGFYYNGYFDLDVSWTQPIINCTISGLTAGVTYNVTYMWGYSSYNDEEYLMQGGLTADSQGKVSFAILGAGISNYHHAIMFSNVANQNDRMVVDLGQKTLSGSVYNVTRTAVKIN